MSDFDTTVLTQLAEDLTQTDLRAVLKAFESDMYRLGAALTAAAEAGDIAAYRRSAHALAGAAGTVGAVGLERIARRAMAIGATIPEASLADVAAIAGLVDDAINRIRWFVDGGRFTE